MIQVLQEYWFLLAAGASLVGWLLVHSFKIGGLYQRFTNIELDSGKIVTGVEAKRMADSHEVKLSDIQHLCVQRGEQMVRMDTVILNLNKTMDRFETKLDRLSYAINQLVKEQQ